MTRPPFPFWPGSPKKRQPDQAEPVGLLAPLSNPVFRALWLTSVAVNIGTIMEGLAAAWLMTNLTSDPGLVALVQTAATLPALLISVPAGVMADSYGKRLVLAVASLWALAISLILAILVFSQALTPVLLLAMLFILHLGRAAKIPAWQALVQDVVGQRHLASAISLNSMSFNGARTVGPALGGWIIGLFGIATVYLLGAVSSLLMYGASRKLKHAPPDQRPTPASLYNDLREGARFVATGRDTRVILCRLGLFVFGTVSIWAFLPLMMRERFAMDASDYGLLLAVFGISSVIGASLLPKLRRHFSVNTIVPAAGFIYIPGLALVAWGTNPLIVSLGLLLAGASWVISMVSFNVTMQQIAPNAIRGRVMSFHFLTVQACWAIGSLTIGAIATTLGITQTLTLVCLFLALVTLGGLLYPLPETHSS